MFKTEKKNTPFWTKLSFFSTEKYIEKIHRFVFGKIQENVMKSILDLLRLFSFVLYNFNHSSEETFKNL